ncbi:MAG TPA: VWA domain-containing protein [Thermoanaerobaculia bacterium]|nr:VWA domain-containing protein [Thermoanaerobaculia bacterium]
MRLHVAAALLLVAFAAAAQVGEKITVNVIEVPVTVVDGSGNSVRGLTAENFELFDDGTRRAITAIEAVDFAAAQEDTSAFSPVNPAARRSFMLLFDLGFSSPTALARAQEAARRFVRDTVKPRDLIAVGSISPERGFRLLTAFTTDRDLIAAALAEPASFRPSDPLQLAAADPPSSGGRVVSRPFSVREEARQQSRTPSMSPRDAFAGMRIEKEIDGLSALATMMRAVPGRKQIVLLSEGFDPEYVRGRTADPELRYGNSASMRMLREMAKSFRASDSVLHAIDIHGVRAPNSASDALFLLARPTGGEVFANTNDLGRDFSTMLRRQEVVYVLAFQAPAMRRGQFHNLEIRLAGVPGARASYRSGYYESGGETPIQKTLSNADIIINDIPQDGVRISAVSAAFPSAGERAQVPIIVEIDGAALLKTPAADVYIYAFDDEGLVRDRLYQKMTFDLTKVGERLGAGGVKYYGTLALPPGRYAVKTLVRVGDNERRGFARTEVVVPRGDEMSLASFFIDERPGDWIMVKGTSHDPAAAYPFSISGEAFVPSATARPRCGGMRKLAVIVYNAQPDDLTLQMTAASKVLRKVASGAATQLVIELDAPPAQASFEVSVHKKDGVASARLALQ